MRILDGYIVRRFLANFIVLLALLFVFAVSVDLLLELDEYVDVARERAGEDSSALTKTIALIGVVVNFHGPRIFQFYAYMLGLLTVGAMGFTLAQMHRHRELVAVLAAGVKLQRLALPLVITAFCLNLLQLVNQEMILPRLAPMLIRSHDAIGKEGVDAFEMRFTRDGKGNLFQAPLFDPNTNTLQRLTILERDDGGRTVRRITADEARWNERDGAWHLTNGRVLVPQKQGSQDTTYMLLGHPIERYPTDLTPEVVTMRRFREFATMLSLGQIQDMLRSPGVVDSDALIRFAFARFTTVLINMIVLVMTLPFFLVREPVSLLRNSVLCAGTAIPATMGALLAFALDLPGIPPVVGVFLPVLVLVPVAMYMVSLIKT